MILDPQDDGTLAVSGWNWAEDGLNWDQASRKICMDILNPLCTGLCFSLSGASCCICPQAQGGGGGGEGGGDQEEEVQENKKKKHKSLCASFLRQYA
ncbi:hypothetical protein ACJZ2D_005386 [Fusarium nematophilum]